MRLPSPPLTTLLLLALAPFACVPADDALPPEDITPVWDARVWISPASGSAGVPRTVALWGAGTDFRPAETQVDFGEGVEVGVLLVDSSFHLRAQLLVAPDAALGPRDVTVTWNAGADQRVLRDGFVVESGSLDLSPRGAALGETVLVEVTGWGTVFTPGLTIASLGPGIEVPDGIEVLSSSRLRFTAHVDPRADVGPRDLVVYNGPLAWTLRDAFHVDRSDRAMRIAPDSADQRQRLEVRVTAEDGGFLAGQTEVDLGTGVVIEQVTVIDAEHLAARIRVGNNARVGLRDVEVSTLLADGPHTRLLLDGFLIRAVEGDPANARVSLSFGVSRSWQPDLCAFRPQVSASAVFYEPNDFPCPSPGGSSTLSAPPRFDLVSQGFSQPSGGSTDCPTPMTYDAGPTVAFVSDDATVTLARDYDPMTARISYLALSLTEADFVPNTAFALHTTGGDLEFNELPAWQIPDALRTLPRDFAQTEPDLCALSHPLGTPLEVRWTAAQTYDVADMYLYITGPSQPDGFPMLYVYPWDDGAYTFPSEQLEFFTSGYAELIQVATMRTRFDVPGATAPLAGIGSSTIFWRGGFNFE